MEKKNQGELISDSIRWISVKDVMDRWGVEAHELQEFVNEHGMPIFFKHPRQFVQAGRSPVAPLPLYDLLTLQGLYRFRAKDVLSFEQAHPELQKQQTNQRSVYAGSSTPRAMRRDQRHKSACQDVAKRLWDEDPHLTIAAAINRPEILAACEGVRYLDKTIRKWINEWCPNRKPGRRPKKTPVQKLESP